MQRKWSFREMGGKILTVFVMALCLLPFTLSATAQLGLPILGGDSISQELPTPDAIRDAQRGVENPGSGVAPSSTFDVISEVVLSLFRLVLIGLQVAAVMYFVYIGITMIVSMDKEDQFVKNRQAMINAVIGFIVMSLGDRVIEVFNPWDGSAPRAEGGFINPHAWVATVAVVKDVIKYSVWTIAVVLVVIIGVRMISSQDKDTKKERSQLTWIAIGLFVMQIADLILTPFLGGENAALLGAPTTELGRLETGNTLINNITNTILFLFIPFSVFGIIVGSFYLLTARGDEAKLERAKNIFIGIVVAAIVAFSAYTIVSEVAKFDILR